jgi:prolipoprotein diacylglyceryltransferase
VLAGPVVAYLPSPPASGISIGPVRLHVYGLLIAAGVVAAVWCRCSGRLEAEP